MIALAVSGGRGQWVWSVYLVGVVTIFSPSQTGTGVYLEALPPPSKLSIMDKDKSSNAKQLLGIQEALNKSQQENTLKYGLMNKLVRCSCVYKLGCMRCVP